MAGFDDVVYPILPQQSTGHHPFPTYQGELLEAVPKISLNTTERAALADAVTDTLDRLFDEKMFVAFSQGL